MNIIHKWPRDDFSVLAAFLAVAEERSFTRAAKRLAVSPSALSHSIRGLEERLGVRLLSRTTRSVAPTDAGEQLLRACGRRLATSAARSTQLAALRDKPAGHVRLAVSPVARGDGARADARAVRAGPSRRRPRCHDDVRRRVDLVAGRFDAGIQLGEFIERDMIAVRVSPDQRAAIVGSPGYFETHPTPVSPRDLTRHRCINFRHG